MQNGQSHELDGQVVGAQVSQVFGGGHTAESTMKPTRSLPEAMRRGLFCRCPHCGEGSLFRSFVKPVTNCSVCEEDYTAQRADDLPAYLTVMIVGHVVVAAFFFIEAYMVMSLMGYMSILVPMTIVLSLLILQPIKGATIGLQWALFMHGFGGKSAEDYT